MQEDSGFGEQADQEPVDWGVAGEEQWGRRKVTGKCGKGLEGWREGGKR